MFVRAFTDLPVPFGLAEESLLRSPQTWVPGLASDADARGERLLAEVGVGRPGRRINKQVEIDVGPSVRFPSKTVLQLSWRAVGPKGLFPELEGDLEIAPMGPTRSQVSLSARYVPPLGAAGKLVDRALLHRVAEATVQDFVHRTAETLEALALEQVSAVP
ncbi:MAG: hypothetical protein M3Q23_01360 [Actinomycetota bacterium]|nr:hypothetical protein [Actinomycetota bacterium]